MKLQGIFHTRSPLSHISQSISTGSLLNELPMLQNDGSIENVFCYNGNAWRGQIRDLCALYILHALGVQHESIAPTVYDLLFSGGKIGGKSKFDLKNQRRWLTLMPHFALLGMCLDNMALEGKISVFDSIPLCYEAVESLPESMRDMACDLTSYKNMTLEREFTHKDDSKSNKLNVYLAVDDGDETEKVQMRYSCELLNANVRLFNRIILDDSCTTLEIGAFCSALSLFSKKPMIGGQHNKGHGLVDLVYTCETGQIFYDSKNDTGTGQPERFNECLHAYSEHLEENKHEIKTMLCGS